MLIKLHFPTLQKTKKYQTLNYLRKTACHAFTVSAILLFSAMKAQTSLTVPNLTVAGAFTGPFANSTRTYQMIIDDSQLTALSGKYITSISLRIPTTAAAAWPASNTTYPDYQIYLSDGVEPANRQLNFAANVVGTQTQVRSGSLLIPSGAVTNNGNFSFDITFNTPYLYTGTNLVIEIRHTGSNGTTTSIDAVGTGTAGYGTLFTACWSSSTSVLQGNFSYVKINSGSVLGVKSVEIDGGASVYPNPVKDQLYVKSANDIVELNIFNMVGQKVYSQKNSVKNPQLNVSGLAKGNYILQMIDKNGNSTSTRFIKD
ncbi:T9SS type A sorting domain-containing protein [uncultured Chryseobacterium sp.]|uniref:T9SS type A sorting domain-containing protein n=1 Tax=uncultured Chryseobacterium sp. TaxID=259322 RepID=UPI0025873598|nr:T9SS type A sorting domain-containing protein [uncultured Chryseobacterium sp.]